MCGAASVMCAMQEISSLKTAINVVVIIHDHVWPLPFREDYSDVLNSNFADMASPALVRLLRRVFYQNLHMNSPGLILMWRVQPGTGANI